MSSVLIWWIVAEKEAIVVVRLLLDVGPPTYCHLSPPLNSWT